MSSPALTAAVGAGLCAALAVALVAAPAERLSPPGGRRGLPPVAVVVVVSGAAVLALVARPIVLGWAAVALSAGLAGHALWRRSRRHRTALAVSARVLECCDLLAAELAAGQPAGHALARAAEEWPPLGPVAEAFGLGGDVPTALRELAATPGAGDLRLVAAAWQVGEGTGLGPAGAVRRVADGLRAAHETRRVVASELASARATARLLAALPVAALVMGSGAGGDPWSFLLGTAPGLVCLGTGLLLALAGIWWIEGLARSVEEER